MSPKMDNSHFPLSNTAMIKQGLLLLAAAAACLALGDRGHYSKKNALQAPSQYASVASFHASKPEPAQPGFASKPEPVSAQQQQSGYAQPEPSAAPQPYAFGYEAAGSSRQESGDASGKVWGSYRVRHEDGSVRIVKYVADKDGFRADIDTDEQGTGPDSPAHVQLKSSAPPTPNKVTPFSAPAVQPEAPIRVPQYSAPVVRQQAPLQAPKFSATSALPQAPLQASHFSAPAAQQAPQPYAFSYDAQLSDGSSSRSESSDASGRVTGQYSLSDADGRTRTVSYTADQGGFRADLDSNEFGAGPREAPADVTFRQSPAAPLYAPQNKVNPGIKSAFMRAPASSYQGQSSVGYNSLAAVDQQQPSPYSFEYAADLEDGSLSRTESADASGRVVGSYSLSVADGRKRKVDYLADAQGFRATVDTNEFGTKAESPADVQFYSSATLDEPAPYHYSARRQAAAATSAGAYSQQGSQYSAPAIQQAPIEVTRFSAPAVQQAPVQYGAYSMGYQTSLEDGGSLGRRESGDGSGTVTGQYSLSAADGRRREVDYSADSAGFRASLRTNEPGTRSESPASAQFYSSAQPERIAQQHVTQFSAPPAAPVQQAPLRATHFSAPAVQQAPIQVPHQFSAPALQQAPAQVAVPSPYAFEYESDGSARRESADASGKVTGSYEVRHADGSMRVVEYVADASGFRANVKTNEAGTQSDSPAHVVIKSDAPPVPQSAPVRQPAPFPARSPLQTQKTSMISQKHVEAFRR